MVNSYGEARILASLSGYGRTPNTPYRRYQPGGASKPRRSRTSRSRRRGASKYKTSRRGRVSRPRRAKARTGELEFFDAGMVNFNNRARARKQRIYRRVVTPRQIRRSIRNHSMPWEVETRKRLRARYRDAKRRAHPYDYPANRRRNFRAGRISKRRRAYGLSNGPGFKRRRHY